MNSQVPFKYKLWRSLLLSAVIWLLLLISIPVLIVYRTFIDLVLKIKLGKNYGGLFDTADTFFLVPDTSKCCITTVMYIRSEKELDLFHIIRDILQKKIFNNPKQYLKLTSSKHDFGGYAYWIKNNSQVDDVVQPLKILENVDFNEEYLKKCTAEITSAEHGKDGTVLWDAHISGKPLKGDYDDNCHHYPVIFRFHHAIADGTSIVALFLRLFGDETSKNYGEQLFNKLFRRVHGQNTQKISMELINQYLSKSLKALRLYLEIFFLSLGRFVEGNYLQPQDVNALHASHYSGEKIVAWSTEDNVKCVPLIKNIKNRTKTTFTSVVSTAMSASMTNYFKRNGKPVPDFTSGMITLLLGFPSMDESKSVRMENKTTAIFLELPCTQKSKSLVEALESITEDMNQQMKYSDAMGARLLICITGLFPSKLLSCIAGMKSYTFVFTNVPGGSQIKILDGCILEKIVPCAPNGRGMGISFTFLSYDNQLQVGILVDKTLTESQEEVQKMADDLIYYIKMLDIESRKLYGDV